MPLPLNINDLFTGQVVEWDRLEFKGGWNPLEAVQAICAFANDFHNWGGGYLIFGIAEKDGRPQLPPKGLTPAQADEAQRKLLELGHRLQPSSKNQFVTEYVRKHADREAAERHFNLPYAALEEAVANAVYHRSYEEREPIEIRITPDEVTVLSFPGPYRSINMDDIRAGRAVARRYRNRRIGEFLKELDLTEGRSTGIPKILEAMANNGSETPSFETDPDRTSFLVRLPVRQAPEEGGPSQVIPQVTPEVTPEVRKLLGVLTKAMGRKEIMAELDLKDEKHFRESYQQKAMQAGLIEYTIPDKPQSSLQKYRLTEKGRQLLQKG